MNDEAIWTIAIVGDRSMALLMVAFALWIFLTLALMKRNIELKRTVKPVKPMFYTDDPIRDSERWIAAQEAKLEGLPECADCGNPIQDETAFYINGEWICEDCMEAYRQEVMPE